jgi:hypothetical protein
MKALEALEPGVRWRVRAVAVVVHSVLPFSISLTKSLGKGPNRGFRG